MKRYDLQVSHLMSTALITIRASEPVTGAHAEMQVGVVRHLPVVDDRGRLVGVLSDRDVMRVKKGQHVADIMTHSPITVRPDTAAHAAASLMLDNTISSLPVVDEQGTLVGVITMTDFVDLARRALLGLPLER